MIHLTTPLTDEKIAELKTGDHVTLSGTIYTARDAAHRRMLEHLKKTGEMLLSSQVIFYAGPCPAKPNEVIGSIGATTSYRMDNYTEVFIKSGCRYSIGKGMRSERIKELIRNYRGVHFDAIGGAGAYYKNCVKSANICYFQELGAEAVYALEVENIPLIVSIV